MTTVCPPSPPYVPCSPAYVPEEGSELAVQCKRLREEERNYPPSPPYCPGSPAAEPVQKRVKKEFKYDDEEQKIHDAHAEWVNANVNFGVFEQLLEGGVYQSDRGELKQLLDRRMTTKGGLFGKSTERAQWVEDICVGYDDGEEAPGNYEDRIGVFEQNNGDEENTVSERLLNGICHYICMALYDHDVGCEEEFGNTDEEKELYKAVCGAIPFKKMYTELGDDSEGCEIMSDPIAVEEVFHAAIEYVINYKYGGDKAKFNGIKPDEDSDDE